MKSNAFDKSMAITPIFWPIFIAVEWRRAEGETANPNPKCY